MDFIELLTTVIIASLIFTPINKKYKFRSKYHDHSNKHFRFFMAFTGLLSVAIEIFIAFSTDYYLKSVGLNRDLISFIFEIPMLFFILVAMPFTNDK